MNRYSFTLNGYTFTRITRTKARTVYAHGLPVMICPCNLRPSSQWHPETIIDPQRAAADEPRDIRPYLYYYEAGACINDETGRYLSYYIPVRTVNGVESYDYSYMEGGKERA